MELSPDQVDLVTRIVRQILAERAGEVAETSVDDGVHPDVEAAVRAARQGFEDYRGCSVEDRRRFIGAIRRFCTNEYFLSYMCEQTVRETRMGNAKDKYLKNLHAARHTPGVEDICTRAWSGDEGLTTVEYSPYGVIGAICPTTNPTATIINNAIGMLAAGNTVVFAPHPRAQGISIWLVRKLNAELAKAGAPKNLLVTLADPSQQATGALMEHPGVDLLVVTGGRSIVQRGLRSGKKTIGAGPGNPPVVVDQTADIAHAARCIVAGSAFDNNLACIAEKEVIAVDSIADLLIHAMQDSGAYLISDPVLIHQLVSTAVLPDCSGPSREWVGRPATDILRALGVTDAPWQTRLILVETEEDHPLVQLEMLMPVLPLVRVPTVEEAISMACRVEHGCRHTAVMHSRDVGHLTAMARAIQTTVFVKNGASFNGVGIQGEGYPSMTIAGPTGEGLTSARSFTRARRCVLVGTMNIR